MRALNAVVGFAVCALTIAMGAWMIIRADAKLKQRQAAEGTQSCAEQGGAQTGMPTVPSAEASDPQTERVQNAAEDNSQTEQTINAKAGAEQEHAKGNAAASGGRENTKENCDERR